VRLVLGPGASGRAASMTAYVDGFRRRGLQADAIDLPRGPAQRAAASFVATAGSDVVAGGHSFGGRAASLAALEAEFAGLVLFSFPLAGQAAQRTAHFPELRLAVLMLSGDRDPLAPAGELRSCAQRLPNGRLVLYPGAGHGLAGVLEEALDEAAAFAVRLVAG
jgi:predicted alpha/beta-hydrolase family hydrolase